MLMLYLFMGTSYKQFSLQGVCGLMKMKVHRRFKVRSSAEAILNTSIVFKESSRQVLGAWIYCPWGRGRSPLQPLFSFYPAKGVGSAMHLKCLLKLSVLQGLTLRDIP